MVITCNQSRNTVCLKKQIDRSVWSIALWSRQFGLLSFQRPPFNFKHFSASPEVIYLKREMPTLPLTFLDNQYIDGYRSLFATAWKIDVDNSLDISRFDHESGYCIFGFDICPSLCHGEPQVRKRNGTLRANIEFRAPLPNSINVTMHMEFDNNIFLDKTTRIAKDY